MALLWHWEPAGLKFKIIKKRRSLCCQLLWKCNNPPKGGSYPPKKIPAQHGSTKVRIFQEHPDPQPFTVHKEAGRILLFFFPRFSHDMAIVRITWKKKNKGREKGKAIWKRKVLSVCLFAWLAEDTFELINCVCSAAAVVRRKHLENFSPASVFR